MIPERRFLWLEDLDSSITYNLIHLKVPNYNEIKCGITVNCKILIFKLNSTKTNSLFEHKMNEKSIWTKIKFTALHEKILFFFFFYSYEHNSFQLTTNTIEYVWKLVFLCIINQRVFIGRTNVYFSSLIFQAVFSVRRYRWLLMVIIIKGFYLLSLLSHSLYLRRVMLSPLSSKISPKCSTSDIHITL